MIPKAGRAWRPAAPCAIRPVRIPPLAGKSADRAGPPYRSHFSLAMAGSLRKVPRDIAEVGGSSDSISTSNQSPMKTKSLLFPLLFLLALATNCFALEDTPENRTKEADRYLKATPPSEMMADMTANMSKNVPEESRAAFVETMSKNLDVAALTVAMKQSMIKHFTADELKGLADFYSTPEGKSAMKKMGVYMGDVMPAIQAEVQKAMQKTKEATPKPE